MLVFPQEAITHRTAGRQHHPMGLASLVVVAGQGDINELCSLLGGEGSSLTMDATKGFLLVLVGLT